MRTEVRTALLSFVGSVTLSVLGVLYISGQYTARIDQNSGDIVKLQASDTRIEDLVTQIRIDMASNTASMSAKLDQLLEREK